MDKGVDMVSGTEETRQFYDAVGWTTDPDGVSVDEALFRAAETDGPIRTGIYQRRWTRITAFLDDLDCDGAVLEVGCGGSPEKHLLARFKRYTGVDFSATGLELAKKRVADHPTETAFHRADAVHLPFDDDSFDCVFSAHMIYHIADPAAQAAAIAEMQRVLKPGGALVLHLANPRPLLFPARLVMRVVAENRVLAPIARRIKGPAPVPYNPQTIKWTLARLSGLSQVDILGGGVDSTRFRKTYSEQTAIGRAAWRFLDYLDRAMPKASAWLGNYVCYLCRK
ncbi:MAG: class I SAM-dependent methyltransferase [Pseudomonadota bacterium]